MINYKKDYIIYKSYVDGLLSNPYIKSIDNKIFCHIKAILNLAFYKSIDKNTIIITIDGTDIINDTISETSFPISTTDFSYNVCNTLPSCIFTRSPIRMALTSPRNTALNQMLQSLPI